MTVGTTSATGAALNAASQQASTPAKKELTPDDFITLFLAQMRNQNPMNPSDSNAILQQMAQISQISASKSMQDTLNTVSANVASALSNTQMLQATQLIGQRVQIPSKVSPLNTGEGLSGSGLVPGAATDVTFTIRDTGGNLIKTISNGPAASGGLVDFKWDGTGDNGQSYPAGIYQISANAIVDGKPVNVPTAGSFKVNSVALDQKNGGVILNVEQLGGTSMGDIIKIL